MQLINILLSSNHTKEGLENLRVHGKTRIIRGRDSVLYFIVTKHLIGIPTIGLKKDNQKTFRCLTNV